MDSIQPGRAKGNLLIVDDDLLTRQAMEAFLAQEGYEVRCAPNGEMALTFSQEDPPELILLDIRLPDVDGFEVCRRLKEDHRTRNIPVIFISGLDETVDKVKGFAAGGVDYITKPFQGEEVLARVGSHLDLKRTREALQRTNEELERRVADRTAELNERLRFEQLLSDLSARFVNIPPDRVDCEIERGLRQILEFLQVDRCVLLRSSQDGNTWQITHAAFADGLPTLPVATDLASTLFPYVSKRMVEQHEACIFASLEDLPEAASIDKQTYRKWGIRSALNIPIVVEGAFAYGMAISSDRSEKIWPGAYLPRLQLLGEIFLNALERKQIRLQLEERLREIENLKQRLEQENIYLQEEVRLLVEHTEIVGQSLAMRKVLAQAEQVAPTDSTVLIQGETGTGKELLARAIHSLSPRKDRPLVTVNCASLPPTLIEGELFGRERGAYTGALTKMIGRFEIADGSTLFLDEIGELPLELQSKLLRVLEEGNFERLGSTKTLHVNVRIIAATNRDIDHEVKDGKFRKDLFYRLNVFPILIPPLRERREDIPLLVWSCVREFQKKMGKRIDSIPKRTMDALQSYSWPGNVREVRNVTERAIILSNGRTLNVPIPTISATETPEDRNLHDVERRHIMGVLEKTSWRLTGKDGAAELLGLKRTTLQSKMKKLGIKRPSS